MSCIGSGGDMTAGIGPLVLTAVTGRYIGSPEFVCLGFVLEFLKFVANVEPLSVNLSLRSVKVPAFIC